MAFVSVMAKPKKISTRAAIRRGAQSPARFVSDEDGVVLPFVALILVVAFALGALALDMSRYYDLQSQMQKAADAFALAGAEELNHDAGDNGSGSSIQRATKAINNLVSNSSAWGGAVQVQSITFYSVLPGSGGCSGSDVTSPIPSGCQTTDPTLASFVQVVVTPISVNSFLPLTLVGMANNSWAAIASAVAGFSQSICGVTPIAICNGSGANNLLDPKAMAGKEIYAPLGLAAGGTPSYDFVDAMNCGNSSPCVNKAFGANVVDACTSTTDPVPIIPGTKTSTSHYFDTRFDLYSNDAKNADPTVYSPDLNNRKGYLRNSGTAATCMKEGLATTGALPLPNDSNIASALAAGGANWTSLNGMIGNGNWSAEFSAYNTVNFAGALPAATKFSSRYAIYNYEITHNCTDAGCDNGSLLSTNSVGANGFHEQGMPICASQNNRLADRRIMYAVVLDCSSSVNYTPRGVVKFFILQPLYTTSGGQATGGMLVEYVSLASPNQGNVIHDNVQLFR
jgi:Flp pilus assembly protein TadG